jgi:LuxR family maltose regulon positive regulatory protein
VGLADLARERNDLPAATQYLQSSQALGEHKGLPQYPYRWRVAMARIRAAEGDLDGALSLLKEAERRYTGDFSPNVRPVAAWIARLWVAQGQLGEALAWVRTQGLSVDDDLSYLREFQHLTLARVLLARYRTDHDDQALGDVQQLLERLQQAAEAGGRAGSVIECLMLRALTHQAQGNLPAAIAPLERALKLAEPAGYVRLFVDEGPPMARLLHDAAARGRLPGFAGQLLAAIAPEQPAALAGVLRPGEAGPQPLLEPLSQRELEVLRLFKADLSGPEIAEELVIALSTLRTHTKRIYSKLNVNSRRAAVSRATELGLI